MKICHEHSRPFNTHFSSVEMDGTDQGEDPQLEVETEIDSTASQDEENHEMEVGFESEADLLQKLTTCIKNPGHKLFIPVRDFNESHLPSEYRGEDMVKLVQHQIALAVRLRVNGSSPHRPEFIPGTSIRYPFSSFRDRKRPRVGSGWVESVMKYPDLEKKDCPCQTCQNSGEPVERWAEIWVRTAAHVVYDIVEGRFTTCYFFYDSDDMSLSSCPTLRGAVDVRSAAITDTCFMAFITHNMDLVNQLFTDVRQYQLDRFEIRNFYKINNTKPETLEEKKVRRANLRTQMTQGLEPDKRNCRVLDIVDDESFYSEMFDRLMKSGGDFNVKTEMEALIKEKLKEMGEWLEESGEPESQNLGIAGTSDSASSIVEVKGQLENLTVSTSKKGNRNEQWNLDPSTSERGFRNNEGCFDQSISENGSKNDQQSFDPSSSEKENRNEQGSLDPSSSERRDRNGDTQKQPVKTSDAGRCMAAGSCWKDQSDLPVEIPQTETENNEVSRNQIKSDRSDEATATAESFPDRKKYVPSHSLTIMVSHPHGRSKRITVGHIIERASHYFDQYSTYTYTNATCPGSSGARVFILGKSCLIDHAHSKFGGVQTGSQAQINESVLSPEI